MKQLKKLFKPKNIVKIFIIIASLLLIISSLAPAFFY